MSSFTHYRVGKDLQTPIIDSSPQLSGSYLEILNQKLKINIIALNSDDIVFDLVGVDAPIANALRRILLAEVPTIAVEDVWITENTSIIQDEVLAHRIGLIPIKVDPSKLDYVQAEGEENDSNTIVFNLAVSCPYPSAGTVDAFEYTENVYSSHLVWIPQGNQLEEFPEGIAPVNDDILIAKLKPGQQIMFEAHCRKGVGKDHTKFSPVATAAYRLLPDISFLQPVQNESAEELQAMCPMQVFDIEDMAGVPTAVAKRPRDCTMCRECIRKEGWSDRVSLRRKTDHYIFTVESTGCMPPEVIVKEALGVLRQKAQKFQSLIDEILVS